MAERQWEANGTGDMETFCANNVKAIFTQKMVLVQ